MDVPDAERPAPPALNDAAVSSSPESDRQQRIDALQRLASERLCGEQVAPEPVVSHASGAITAPDWRSRRRWLGGVGVVTLAILVVAVGLLTRLPQRGASTSAVTSSSSTAIPDKLVLDLRQHSLDCPVQSAWSPDTVNIAVTLTREGCDASPGAPQSVQIAVFDARTGALKQTFDTQHLAISGGNAPTTGAILWSRDGRSVIFDATTSDSQGNLLPALIIFPLDGSKPRVLHGAAVATNGLAASIVWDISAGKAVALAAPLTPALSYQWGANGALSVAQAFPPDAAAHGYSGSPILTPGSQTVPFWQPGVLVSLSGVDSRGATTPLVPRAAYAYAASAYLWSPDGRYLSAPLRLVGRLSVQASAPAGQLAPISCAAQNVRPACTSPAVQFPDRAIQAIIQASNVPQLLAQQGQPSIKLYPQESMPLAWRPDGTVLATILPVNGFDALNATPQTISVTLYDTANGQQIATLGAQHTPGTGGATQPGDALLNWSPTGKQLAFVDYNSNRVVIWGGAQLPA